MKYKHIIFDFGNVLAKFDTEQILSRYCSCPKDFPLMHDAVFYDWDSMDKGVIAYEDYMAHAESLLPASLRPALKELAGDWYKQLTPLEDTWLFAREAKKQGYSLYILSNAPTVFAENVHLYPITTLFDGMVFSGPLKMAKPEPQIYEYLFDTFHLKPEECLFLDDKKENIEAAQALGMDGIIFSGDLTVVRKQLEQ